MPDVEAAKCEAVKIAGQIICDESDKFWREAEWTMAVADDRGLTQFQLQVIGIDAPSIRSASSGRA